MLPKQLRVLDGVGGTTPVDVPVALPKPPVTLVGTTAVPVPLAPPEPLVCVEFPAVPVGLKGPPICVELPEPGKGPPVPVGTCPVALVEESTLAGTDLDVVTPPPT